jgi:glutamate-1-semialdehyde 2,1-aminomutase
MSEESPARSSDLSNKYIPGGVSSINRIVSPSIAFERGDGAYMWDEDGNKYLDFHAGFAPHLLGHNQDAVNNAVIEAIGNRKSLFGSGPTDLEGELAALLCTQIDALEKVTLLNTCSEATALAVKLSRAVTGRDHFIVMQGGYNGNGDEVACNVFNSFEEIGPRVSPGEYPIKPLGAGTLIDRQRVVHVVNFNDLESIRYVCKRYPVAAVLSEPVLQNIGVIKPVEGYLSGLRALADEFGFLLIHDEVKTGFRQGIGGYSSVAKVQPDLVTYGKAVANGFPIAMLGGKAKYLDQIAAEDPSKRPLVAGTYNGHPVAVSAAIATVKLLKNEGAEIFGHLENLGQRAEDGIQTILKAKGVEGCVARVGSAFSFYFMDHKPRDFHDMLTNHDFDRDVELRRKLISEGVYFVPIATKQCSISAAHSEQDIDFMLDRFEHVL